MSNCEREQTDAHQQLKLVFDLEKEKLEQQFHRDSNLLRYDHLKSISHDPGMIEIDTLWTHRGIIDLIEEMLYNYSDFCLQKAHNICPNAVSLDEARQAVWSLFDKLKEETVLDFQSDDHLASSASRFFDLRIRPGISKRFAIAEFDWPTADARRANLNAPPRAPAVKAGRPPSDAEILEKAEEMKARGMTGYELASMMRHETGFANVTTTAVRGLILKRWKGGRPKKKVAQ